MSLSLFILSHGRALTVGVRLSLHVLALTVNLLDQGILRVDLIDGREIHGADRSGKSDPYAVFTLNGQKVFKSQTKKKTLTPQWDENFTVSVVGQP